MTKMVRRDLFRQFRREYLHGLRNLKSEGDAYMAAMDAVKASVWKELEGINEFDRREQWADIAEGLLDVWLVLKDLPVDKSKIPPKSEMIDEELKAASDKGKG